MPPDSAESRRGLAFGVTAYVLWGALPLYWPLLRPASAIEILAHRMLWSLFVVAILLWATHRWRRVATVARNRRQRALLVAAAALIAGNWGVYIWAVNDHQVIETSLGYFINPLLTILLGVLVLHERLRPAQWAAVGIASLAIVVLTIDYGRLPWIALVLAVTFCIYGFIKKRANVGAVESLAIETAAFAVPALLTLVVIAARGGLAFGRHGVGHASLLVGTGLITVVPLLCFAAAAIRLPLSTMGLLQYLAPVLQFLVGVLVDHEPMPAARLAGFGLVWIALVVLTVDGLRHARRATALARSAESVAV